MTRTRSRSCSRTRSSATATASSRRATARRHCAGSRRRTRSTSSSSTSCCPRSTGSRSASASGRSTVPIIMLTARDDELDKVLGLELGADDYITKPFLIREFRSRVRAVLRRAATPHLGGRREETIDRGDVKIDLPRRTVEVRGEPVQLTFVEFELLALLASQPGRGLFAPAAARAPARGRGLPRAADDRRPRPPSAREDRAGAARAGADSHGSRRRLPLPRRMSIPGGIRVKLSLALLGIVGGALLVRLRHRRSRRSSNASSRRSSTRCRVTPRRSPSATRPTRRRTGSTSTAFVDGAGFISNSRVAVFSVGGVPGRRVLVPLGDSSAGTGVGPAKDTTALEAAESVRHGARARQARRAAPTRRSPSPLLNAGNVMLLSSSLSDQLATVAAREAAAAVRDRRRALISRPARVHGRRHPRPAPRAPAAGRRSHRRGCVRRAGRG